MVVPNSRYLVTGGCGFIGSHLVDALLGQGHQVRILDNLTTGQREIAPAGAELVIGDVVDRAAVREALKKVDGVFHLAAVASMERSGADWAAASATNCLGCVTVLEAARHARDGEPVPVVYASSAAVYGASDSVPTSEQDAPAPVTAYGVDKLGCELHARVASIVYGVPTVGLRYFNVYGPHQNPGSPCSGVILIFCAQVSNGKPMTIHGDGNQLRDFVYVGDVVQATIRAMDRVTTAAEVFNICTGTGTSVLQLAGMVADIAAVPLALSFLEPRPGDVRFSIGNPSRALHALGIKATTSLEEGLRNIISRP
jgi:UDP-glucose 4-epimerase